MRARLLLLIIAILAVAGFAALNWGEVMRTSPLNFGIFMMDAAMGAILLTLLGIGLMAWLLSSTVLRSRMLITENRYTRDLQHQRDLADKAEASRFTELRQYLDSHFREHRQRDAVVTTEFEKTVLQSQRDLRAQMEQMSRALDTRLGQLEGRFDGRFERTERVVDVPDRHIDPLSRDRVKL